MTLVHDYLLVFRGAERTFAAIAECWPDAPLTTLVYDPAVVAERFAGREVRASLLQRLGVTQQNFRALLPLYPWATRHLPVRDARLVVSSSSAFAHGVHPSPGAVHVCYCHSPFRYAWHESNRALTMTPAFLAPAMRLLQRHLRAWDRRATLGVTHYIANSRLTQQRIHDFWGRESTIIHPPVAVQRFAPARAEDYFLFVGELVTHKQVDLALAAARRAGRRLKIVGTGPELERLRAIHGEDADFLGRVSDGALESLLARCRALIVPNVEEFGIAAVEAQASGRPVVAARGGGNLETVLEGKTGLLFPPGGTEALAEILRYTDFDRFSSALAVEHARSFATERFQTQVRRVIAAVCNPGSSYEAPSKRDGESAR